MISLEQKSLPAPKEGEGRRPSNGGGGPGSIERARRYLRQTCESQGFIAGKSGFGSLEQFQAQFLERTGESPSRYRRRILGGEMNWLPEEVDSEKIDAQFKDGVLTVHLPKGKVKKKNGKEIAIR